MERGLQVYLEDYLDNHDNICALPSHRILFTAQNNEKYRYHQVYFLRDPIDRALSVYNFEKKQVDVDLIGTTKAKELDFRNFVKWYLQNDAPATIRNCQTIFISGQGDIFENNDSLNLAKKTIENKYLVGVVNRYDESMVVFNEYLREYFSDIDLVYKITNFSIETQQLNLEERLAVIHNGLGDVVSSLISKNQSDIELYQMANYFLDRRLGRILQVSQKLLDFTEKCKYV